MTSVQIYLAVLGPVSALGVGLFIYWIAQETRRPGYADDLRALLNETVDRANGKPRSK